MKKQLLPKDLAARAQKLPTSKVEAEVLRIISAKPAAQSRGFVESMIGLQAGSILPAAQAAQAAHLHEMNRQARELERFYMAADAQQTPWLRL
jgi:hypothetical protein